MDTGGHLKSGFEDIRELIKATDYLSVAQLYLKDNFLLKRPLSFEDVKPRLLGHWGTCHGINVAYANLYHSDYYKPTDFILGPGHGFPALQANLFLSGELKKVDKKAALNSDGVAYLCRNFSWPEGFPSHASPMTPGVICEGGELGYALGAAYGLALGHPEKQIAVLIGDGELETATALSSLNLVKLLGGKSNGKVLPILHLNGYKISAPTIYGRKSERELGELIRGFGYEAIFIKNDEPAEFQAALEKAGKYTHPFLILKTEKGEGGPNRHDAAHQIPLKKPKNSPSELKELEKWLKSYNINFDKYLIDEESADDAYIAGASHKSHLEKIDVPQSIVETEKPGEEFKSPAEKIGELLTWSLNNDPSFYFFSPDETTSNRFSKIFESSERAWNMPVEEWDLPESEKGHIVELLSENTLFATMAGHLANGERAMLGSYEAFFSVVTSQILQNIKFFKQASEVSWRSELPSVNLLSTSTCWRQDHNGFTHQSPALISALLSVPSARVNCIFPVDDVAAEAAYRFMYNSQGVVNLTTFDKNLEPRWIDSAHAAFQYRNGGASVYGFASDWDFQGDNVDGGIVFTAAGDIATREALYAMEILREDGVGIPMRFVGINSLTYGAIGTTEKTLSQGTFDEYFGKRAPIVANFHGYPATLVDILANYTDKGRISGHGFIEKGSTTTPFEMLALNRASRYNLALDVAKLLSRKDMVAKYERILSKNSEYAQQNGEDEISILR